MARNFNGSTDRIDYANPVNPYQRPVSISAWIIPSSIAQNGYIVNLHLTGDSSFGVGLRMEDSGDRISFYRIGSTNKYRRSANLGMDTTTWQHVCVTDLGTDFTDATEITLYYQGSEPSYSSTQNGVTETSTVGGSLSVGNRIYDDNNRAFSGIVAEVAWWDRSLSQDEVEALAAKISPLTMPQSLVFYADLVRDQRAYIGGNGTLDGTTVTSHVPVNYFQVPLIVPYTQAAPAGGLPVTVAMSHYRRLRV